MDYMVSVIVLTYNQKNYIKQALDSILMQEISFPIEILIGDDASTDGTNVIVAEYAHQHPTRIRPLLNDRNIGPCKNLYQLLQKANGKYIALLEGDDYWTDKNKLQMQVDFLETFPKYSACTHKCTIVDRNGNRLHNQKKIWLLEKEHFTLEDCKGFYLSGQTGSLVFRNFIRNTSHNYDAIYKAHPIISDRTIQTILTAQGPIFHFKETMSAYRNQSSELGQNATAAVFEDNPRSPLENYDLTCYLDEYIRTEFHKRLPCNSVKRMFFSIALVKAIVKPTKERWDIVTSIFFHQGANKLQYLLLFPYEVIKRLFFRIKERI